MLLQALYLTVRHPQGTIGWPGQAKKEALADARVPTRIPVHWGAIEGKIFNIVKVEFR